MTTMDDPSAGEAAIRRLPTTPPEDGCPWCREGRGWCQFTGGPHPCEGVDEHMAAMGDAAKAPTLNRPIRVGAS